MLHTTNGGFLVSKVKQVQGRVLERLLASHGIDAFNGAQGRILFVLWREDALLITALAERTGLAKPTLTSMLDRLETSGLVARAANPTDRRQVLIGLTPAGQALRGAYEQVSEEMNARFYQGFSDDEILAFENALTRILTNLTRKEG